MDRPDTIDSEARRIIRDFPLGIVATVDAAGRPAASPKGTFLVVDGRTLGFADIRSPGTVRNLRARPETEVVFVDPFRRKGVRLAGSAVIVEGGEPRFGDLHARWAGAWPALAHRMRALVLIDVRTCRALSTPPYDDGATEEEMIALYKAKYREIYP